MTINQSEVSNAVGPPLQPFVVHGGTVYVSGQVPLRDGEIVTDGFEEQVRATFENLEATLRKAGSAMELILKCNCYLRHEQDVRQFNEIYRSYFPSNSFPARTTVIASPPNPLVNVEIEAIARAGRPE